MAGSVVEVIAAIRAVSELVVALLKKKDADILKKDQEIEELKKIINELPHTK